MGSFPIKKHFACESNDFMDRILRLKRVVFNCPFSFIIKRAAPEGDPVRGERGMSSYINVMIVIANL